MARFYCSKHEEHHTPRMRVWDTEMRSVGQFVVMTYLDFCTFKHVLEKYGWTMTDISDDNVEQILHALELLPDEERSKVIDALKKL